MKNERIITHFQSYTTALGCVKDLTPYFAGRISIISPTNGMNSTLTAKNGGQDNEFGSLGDNDTVVDELSEIGGVSLGAAAYLVPGLSPVLVGGPIAGMAMGDAISSYVMSKMAADDQDAVNSTEDMRRETRQESIERYFVMVDVDSDEEAATAAGIMARHGAQSERATGKGNGDRPNTTPSPAPERPIPRTDFADPCEVERYDRIIDHPNTVEAPWDEQDDETPMTGDVHAPYSQGGYSLAPIAPISPQGWIDANIGYGNYDIVDPSRMTDDDDEATR